MAPEEAKQELLCLSITGGVLTLYKSIASATLPWSIVQSKFRAQFMWRTKKAEIGPELDLLHISTSRDEADTDRKSLEKMIARLDKLSLMDNADDMKDEHKIRRMHSAIAYEKWTYFALCKLPIVYLYEDIVSTLRK